MKTQQMYKIKNVQVDIEGGEELAFTKNTVFILLKASDTQLAEV